MLRTEPMQKIRLLCLDKDKDSVIIALHKLGAVDLRKSKLDLQDYGSSTEIGELSELLVRVQGAIDALEKREVKKEKHLSRDLLVNRVKKFSAINDIYALNEKRRDIREEEKLLDYAEEVARAFESSNIDFSYCDTKYITVRGFQVENKQIKVIEKELGQKSKDVTVDISRIDKDYSSLLVAYEKGKAGIEELVRTYKLREYDFKAAFLTGVPKQVMHTVSSKRKRNSEELSLISKRMSKLSDQNYSKLVGFAEMLRIEIERAEISVNLKRTERSIMLEGWVPKKQMEATRNAISKDTRGRFVIEDMDAEDELAPTLLNRPKFLKPFDYMVEFFSVPRSDEIDPTWIFIISFPIFYGLMISDVGYGVASFLFVTWVRKITNPEGLVYNAAGIWQLCALSAIFFGFLSNQYFGLQLNQYFIKNFMPLDWFGNVSSIIMLTVYFGIAQVILGLAFGFVNSYKKRHMKIAASKLTSIALIAFSYVSIGGAFFGAFNGTATITATVFAVMMLIATAILTGSEAVEITNLLTHILSYTRIMGFGLGSVIIAFLIDQAFTPTFSHGILLFVVYLIMFIVLHFLNMIVGIFEGIVQGIRLNFVEFFTKFYEGGGIKFKPFSYKRVYTKE